MKLLRLIECACLFAAMIVVAMIMVTPVLIVAVLAILFDREGMDMIFHHDNPKYVNLRPREPKD